jgi:molecular chaperone GrpE
VTDHPKDAAGDKGAVNEGAGNEEGKPFSFTDKRKVDPASGEARPGSGQPAADAAGDPLAGLDFEPSAETAELEKAKAEAAAHLDALQRERASFTNFRNRSLRDQEAARTRGVEDVLTALLPVLDDIERAKAHAELEGPMAAIAEKLDASLAKFGIERFGAVGEVFDPTLHDALMHRETEEVTEPTIELVIEAGYRIGERVVRAARVGVVGPQ